MEGEGGEEGEEGGIRVCEVFTPPPMLVVSRCVVSSGWPAPRCQSRSRGSASATRIDGLEEVELDEPNRKQKNRSMKKGMEAHRRAASFVVWPEEAHVTNGGGKQC